MVRSLDQQHLENVDTGDSIRCLRPRKQCPKQKLAWRNRLKVPEVVIPMTAFLRNSSETAVYIILALICIVFNIFCAMAASGRWSLYYTLSDLGVNEVLPVAAAPYYLREHLTTLRHRFLQVLIRPFHMADEWIETAVNAMDDALDPGWYCRLQGKVAEAVQRGLDVGVAIEANLSDRAVLWIIEKVPDAISSAWWWLHIRQKLEKEFHGLVSKSPRSVKTGLDRLRAFINSYWNRRVPILKLPPEILQEIVSYCDPKLSAPPDARAYSSKGLFYIDNIDRRGKPQIRRPDMPAVRATCRTLHYISSVALFEDACVELLHSDVDGALAWLESQPRNALRGIVSLRIEVQKRRPVNYHAFAKVCRILTSMPRLKTFFLGIPVEGIDNDYIVMPEPGLVNALCWHWRQVNDALWNDYMTMRGFGWDHHPSARWVQDLLLVNQGQLEKFTLGMTRRSKSTALKLFLEKAMVEPLLVRRSYVEVLRMNKRSWTERPSFTGVLQYVESLEE